MSEEKQYLTTAQAAKLLGITRVAVFYRIKNGSLNAKKIGRNFAIPNEELTGESGAPLNEEEKKILDKGVVRTVKEYGETLRLLGKE